MTGRIWTIVMLLAGLAWADPASTQPTTKPTRQTTVALHPATPSTQPTTRPVKKKGDTVPSLRETIAKLQEKRKAEQDVLKVAYIDLDRPVSEAPARFSLFSDSSLTLRSVLERLHRAVEEKSVRAVLLNIGDTEFNLAQAQELRDALAAFNKAGKRSFVYADSYETASYVAATGATDICMISGGEIMIPGVSLETMFAKGLLDKVGVKADYIQIGQYKGADEMYTRTEPSQEVRGELNKILDSIYQQIVEGISNHRNLPRSQVEEMINGVMMTGKVAKDRGFVDHLVDQDGLRAMVKKEMGREVELLHDYGLTKREQMDWSSPFALLSSLAKKPKETDKPAVGLIYAEGVIVDGDGGEGILGGGSVGSDDLRKALRIATRDEDVEAIVLRIDSPGGSALASEVIWQAIHRAAQEKPVIVSIGSMAASGGYYLASGGDHIFADPTAIVGSIGVVGGKFVFKDLFDRVGVHTQDFARGQNANLFSSNEPFTEQQRRLVTNWMRQTYDLFTERVMSTRGKKIKDVDQVAHGRIFAAKQARELGMVDELGGIDKAIAYAAARADLAAGEYEVKTIPPTRTLADLLRGEDIETRMPFEPKVSIAPDSLLRALSPHTSGLLMQQMQVLQLLQKRPVMLVSPYVISVK
ncbi:MAG TPA: signal peptide peptidase SppA [Tepidisphaeraceae bacterium]|nr:signal peptide peptidase SppA [Tepidisphaeraceae bacterium]